MMNSLKQSSLLFADTRRVFNILKVTAGFEDEDTRDERWKVKPEEREAIWGPGERVPCDDAQLLQLAREGDLLKFVRNSWVVPKQGKLIIQNGKYADTAL